MRNEEREMRNEEREMRNCGKNPLRRIFYIYFMRAIRESPLRYSRGYSITVGAHHDAPANCSHENIMRKENLWKFFARMGKKQP